MPGPENPPENEAHDVLAAEAFAMPSRDPSLRHSPITLPDDPTGIAEPHDILAAEEFAMPAPAGRGTGGGARTALSKGAEASRRGGVIASLALIGALIFRRRRGR